MLNEICKKLLKYSMIITTSKGLIMQSQKANFIKRMKAIIPMVLQEQGCIHYEVYESTAEANVLFFFEKWESQSALDNHFKQPYMVQHHADVEHMFPKGYEFHIYEIKE